MKPLKLLHTSDWHIGKTLYGKKRYEEFEKFLLWLTDTIIEQKVDVLLIAGDIFDTTTPSNRAQQLYYRFLCSMAASPCRHVVVSAGNHDSPSFLNAPKELLHVLNIYVIGSVTENIEDEVLILKNSEGVSELIVCAVPYLRDRDIRLSQEGESINEKECKLVDGIRNHYLNVCNLADKKRKELDIKIPIVVMGHLFTAGGQTIDGDGVRELYVGTLAYVSAGIFPDWIDYLALGHLHVPQKVNDLDVMRYSGSPLPMGFGEVKQDKSLCLVEFTNIVPKVQLIKVPLFQQFESIKGDWNDISVSINKLVAKKSSIWIEVIYEGKELIGDLRDRIGKEVSGTQIEIIRVKNNRIVDHTLNQNHREETLDDLTFEEVFLRCLAVHNVPDEQRQELLFTYKETIRLIQEKDKMAE